MLRRRTGPARRSCTPGGVVAATSVLRAIVTEEVVVHQLELTNHEPINTGAGYAQVGCPIAFLSAAVGLAIGFAIAIIGRYPANDIDPGVLAKAGGIALLTSMILLGVITPRGGENRPSSAREAVFLSRTC